MSILDENCYDVDRRPAYIVQVMDVITNNWEDEISYSELNEAFWHAEELFKDGQECRILRWEFNHPTDTTKEYEFRRIA